jgi:hypothetical protein
MPQSSYHRGACKISASEPSVSMLRIQTSFQDAPGDDYYFVLLFHGKTLADQLDDLGLRHVTG